MVSSGVLVAKGEMHTPPPAALGVDGMVVAILVIALDSLLPRSLGSGGFIMSESERFTCLVCNSVTSVEEEKDERFVGDAGIHVPNLVNEASTNKAQSTAYGGQRVDGIGVNLMGPLLPIFIIRVFYLMMVNCPNLF